MDTTGVCRTRQLSRWDTLRILSDLGGSLPGGALADRFSGWFRQVSRRRLIRTPLTTRDLPLRSGDGARPGGNRPSNGSYGKLAIVASAFGIRRHPRRRYEQRN